MRIKNKKQLYRSYFFDINYKITILYSNGKIDIDQILCFLQKNRKIYLSQGNFIEKEWTK